MGQSNKKDYKLTHEKAKVRLEIQASIYVSESEALDTDFKSNHLPALNKHSSLLGGNREREIPDPIPNSEVKPLIADGTTRKSVGE